VPAPAFGAVGAAGARFAGCFGLLTAHEEGALGGNFGGRKKNLPPNELKMPPRCSVWGVAGVTPRVVGGGTPGGLLKKKKTFPDWAENIPTLLGLGDCPYHLLRWWVWGGGGKPFLFENHISNSRPRNYPLPGTGTAAPVTR
jgi:hypothetical protein